jgi:hypothetical protein
MTTIDTVRRVRSAVRTARPTSRESADQATRGAERALGILPR